MERIQLDRKFIAIIIIISNYFYSPISHDPIVTLQPWNKDAGLKMKVCKKAGWSYLSLWGQPVHLGAVREIYWVSREIHIQLRAQCWGYQTFQRGVGTSPALWTAGWTAHSESDIFPPARELWPREGGGDHQAGRKIDRRRKMGKWAGKQWRKSSLAEHLSTQILVYMVRKRQTPSSEGWCP